MEPKGLWQRRAFLGIPISYPQTTASIIVGASQQLLLPKLRQKSKRRERTNKGKGQKRQTPSEPYSSIASSTLTPSSAPGCASPSTSASPPWATGAPVSGALRSRRGGGLGLPTPSRLAGLPLPGAGLGPHPVGPSAIGGLDRRMWTTVSFSHPTPLNGAPEVSRLVVHRTNRVPGSCGLVVGGDVSPLAAPAAKSIWPPCFLKSVDLTSSE